MDEFYSSNDHYTYPNSSVLVNRLGLRVQEKLERAEKLLVSARLIDVSCVPRTFDYTHFRALHFHMFQDVNGWAGVERDVLITKGGSLFAAPMFIRDQASGLLSELCDSLKANKHSVSAFPKILSRFINEMNVVHAFREGNGRHLREFVRHVLEELGCDFKADELRRGRWIPAVIAGFQGNEEPMACLLEDAIVTPATNRENPFGPLSQDQRRRYCALLKRCNYPQDIASEYRKSLHC